MKKEIKIMANKEVEKIIEDLKEVGVEIIKSPMNYYTIKTKKFDSKIELIKECQRLIINNDYTLMSAKLVGDFMKTNLQSNQEWFKEMKDTGKDTFDYFIDMVGKGKMKKFHDRLKEKMIEQNIIPKEKEKNDI